ncbi:MAG: DUF402 domain-containing protein [Chloroflexota bacterium]
MNITVIKLNHNRQETWQYDGEVLERGPRHIVIEAYFNGMDTQYYGMPLNHGDRFIETYYSQRWYNIFEIHSSENDSLRGWYCNICYPADISPTAVSYVDLALDLLVFPDGSQLVLDKDEFDALPLSPQDREQALGALNELQSRFTAPHQGMNAH